jgi:glutathione S-transferase
VKLHLLKGCPFAHRAWIALREKNLSFEPVFFDRGKRPPELEALGPRAKSPTLIDGDAKVFDSQAVVEYIEDRYPEPRLMPASPIGRAEVRMFIAQLADELMPKFGAHTFAALFAPVRDETKIADALAALLACLPPFDARLAGRRFVVGDELSLADITMYTPFHSLRMFSAVEIPTELEHLRAWFDGMAARPSTEYPRP